MMGRSLAGQGRMLSHQYLVLSDTAPTRTWQWSRLFSLPLLEKDILISQISKEHLKKHPYYSHFLPGSKVDNSFVIFKKLLKGYIWSEGELATHIHSCHKKFGAGAQKPHTHWYALQSHFEVDSQWNLAEWMSDCITEWVSSSHSTPLEWRTRDSHVPATISGTVNRRCPTLG